MSIDKFGRYNRYTSANVIRGPAGTGYRLTDEGDYDIENKRLCYVGDAISDEDAVSLKILKQNCLYQIDNQYDAASKNIINLAQPKLSTDAATKLYVDEKLPVITDGIYNFDGCRLSNIGNPKTPTDAVNKEYLINAVEEIENKLFQKTIIKSNNEVDFMNLKLINVAEPVSMTDAVNKEYLFDKLITFRDNMYKVLYGIYKKTTNDEPIKSEEDWKKDYYL